MLEFLDLLKPKIFWALVESETVHYILILTEKEREREDIDYPFLHSMYFQQETFPGSLVQVQCTGGCGAWLFTWTWLQRADVA